MTAPDIGKMVNLRSIKAKPKIISRSSGRRLSGFWRVKRQSVKVIGGKFWRAKVPHCRSSVSCLPKKVQFLIWRSYSRGGSYTGKSCFLVSTPTRRRSTSATSDLFIEGFSGKSWNTSNDLRLYCYIHFLKRGNGRAEEQISIILMKIFLLIWSHIA